MKFLQIILCLTLLLYSTCKVEDIAGFYKTKGAIGGQAFLELNNDSTFLYRYHVGVWSSETSGKWENDGELLIINSDQQPPKDTLPDFRILKQFETKNNSINILIHYPDSSKQFNGIYQIYRDGKLTNADLITRGDCNLSLPKSDFDSINVLAFGYKQITLNHDIKNNIEILLKEIPNYGYEYFTDKVMRVKNGKIINKVGNSYYSARKFRKVK